MAKVKTTVNFAIKGYMDQFMDQTTVNKLGETVVEEIKDQVSQGFSPTRGEGRYQGYSESYSKSIKGGRPRGKTVRPVNLKASNSNTMMDELDYKQNGNKNVVSVGFLKGSKKAEIARYHNEGTDNMPKRQIIPEGNQEFTQTIMRAIKDVYSDRLSAIIRRSNSK